MALFAAMTEKQLLVTTIAVGAVVVLCLGGGIVYVRMRHSAIVQETRQLEEQLRGKKKIEMDIEALRKKKDEMAALTEEMRRILPSEEEASEHELRAAISAFASEAEVSWSAFRRLVRMSGGAIPTGAPANPFVAEESYILDLEGGYHAFASFVNKLEEDCRRLLSVDSFSIDGAGGGLDPNTDSHSVSLMLTAYKFRKPSAPPP